MFHFLNLTKWSILFNVQANWACADFLKLNNSLGQVVIQSQKVRKSPTCLGVIAFKSCQGVWHYLWVFMVGSNP